MIGQGVTGQGATGRRLAALVALLLAFAACAPRPAPRPAVVPVPQPYPGMKLWPNRDPIQSACLNDLAATGAQFALIAQAEPGKGGCTLQNGVKLTRTHVALSRPVELSCPMALRLLQFEGGVLLPEARRVFGQDIAQLNHAGGFTCRRMVGGGGRLSEHAQGRAIDVWGFTLADGTRVSVKEQFRSSSPEGQYLRGVSKQACRFFSVALSPNANADHRDHLHWDIGPWKLCGG
ncbi:extensin family protein [Ferrovibrio sp.]|uniref:extensin-like domain-containing protein n=1 Tax=Ferrovibrio sp. TaxID=1917215 RepID=UPI002ECFD01A